MCGQYGGGVFSKFQEESMETEMRKIRSVVSAKAAHANGGILLMYRGEICETLIEKIRSINVCDLKEMPLMPIKQTDEEFKRDFVKILVKRALMKFFMPSFLTAPMTIFRTVLQRQLFMRQKRRILNIPKNMPKLNISLRAFCRRIN